MLVAIKIVEAELDTGAEEDGARESLLSASISHPNVVVSPVELVSALCFHSSPWSLFGDKEEGAQELLRFVCVSHPNAVMRRAQTPSPHFPLVQSFSDFNLLRSVLQIDVRHPCRSRVAADCFHALFYIFLYGIFAKEPAF